jgi:hypothetical protein
MMQEEFTPRPVDPPSQPLKEERTCARKGQGGVGEEGKEREHMWIAVLCHL